MAARPIRMREKRYSTICRRARGERTRVSRYEGREGHARWPGTGVGRGREGTKAGAGRKKGKKAGDRARRGTRNGGPHNNPVRRRAWIGAYLAHLIVDVVVRPKDDVAANQARHEGVVALLLAAEAPLQVHERLVDEDKLAQVERVLPRRRQDERRMVPQARQPNATTKFANVVSSDSPKAKQSKGNHSLGLLGRPRLLSASLPRPLAAPSSSFPSLQALVSRLLPTNPSPSTA